MLSKYKQYAHSSCIKGVVLHRSPALESDRNSSCFEIKTSSYDQRFKTWGLSLKNHYFNQRQMKKDIEYSNSELKLEKTVRNCLSDLNGMTKVKNNQILVG
jgi:hypothetical protein